MPEQSERCSLYHKCSDCTLGLRKRIYLEVSIVEEKSRNGRIIFYHSFNIKDQLQISSSFLTIDKKRGENLSRDIAMELEFRPVWCNNKLYCLMHVLIGRSLVTWLVKNLSLVWSTQAECYQSWHWTIFGMPLN